MLEEANTIHRFALRDVAVCVMHQMHKLTNIPLSVSQKPLSDADVARGVGPWAISHHGDGGSLLSYRMSRCADMALQLVLADAVAEIYPHHPVLSVWHLRQENRDKLPRFDG